MGDPLNRPLSHITLQDFRELLAKYFADGDEARIGTEEIDEIDQLLRTLRKNAPHTYMIRCVEKEDGVHVYIEGSSDRIPFIEVFGDDRLEIACKTVKTLNAGTKQEENK